MDLDDLIHEVGCAAQDSRWRWPYCLFKHAAEALKEWKKGKAVLLRLDRMASAYLTHGGEATKQLAQDVFDACETVVNPPDDAAAMLPDLKLKNGWIIKQTNVRPQFIVEHENGSILVSNQCNFLHRAFSSQVEAALGIIELKDQQIERLNKRIDNGMLALNSSE